MNHTVVRAFSTLAVLVALCVPIGASAQSRFGHGFSHGGHSFFSNPGHNFGHTPFHGGHGGFGGGFGGYYRPSHSTFFSFSLGLGYYPYYGSYYRPYYPAYYYDYCPPYRTVYDFERYPPYIDRDASYRSYGRSDDDEYYLNRRTSAARSAPARRALAGLQVHPKE